MSDLTSANWRAGDTDDASGDLAAFFGSSAETYLATYRALRGHPGRFVVHGWSWPILIGSFTWFFYRKCYILGTTALLLPVVLSLLHYDTVASLLPFVYAVYGKSLYVQSALMHVSRADRLGLDGRERLAYLRLSGGVSILAGAIGAVLYASVLAVSTINLLALHALR